jgi:hypothetical protein
MRKKSWKKFFFCWCLEGQREPEPDPDQLVTGTDQRIRIRSKMSRIRNISILYFILGLANNRRRIVLYEINDNFLR